jgi:hypothetical protein
MSPEAQLRVLFLIAIALVVTGCSPIPDIPGPIGIPGF